MKRVIKFILGALLGLLVFAAVLLWAATQLLRAAPGEWSQPLRIGAWHVDASVTTLWRIATHPVTLRLLENRSVRTPYGVLQWRADAQRRLWRCFVARHDGHALRVCERIVDAQGHAYTDASNWFWAAQLGQSVGPWQAITIAREL